MCTTSGAYPLVILFGLLLSAGCAIAANPVQTQVQLNYCDDIKQIQETEGIRDMMQGVIYNKRLQREYGKAMEIKDKFQDLSVEDKHAWNTTLSKAELQSITSNATSQIQLLQARAQLALQALHANGSMPRNVTLPRLTNCLMGRLNAAIYPHRPTVSILLQYFKRPWIMDQMVAGYLKCSSVVPLELVVNVDHPADAVKWGEWVTRSNGAVVPVFSANVHEIRAYNRIASVARGTYLLLIQDDDMPPESCTYLTNLLTIFQKYPRVAAIGGKHFVYNFQEGDDNNNINSNMHFKDAQTDIPMQFVLAVDFAPFALRRAALQHVGGLDEGLSESGECGIWSDWELCMRLWSAGWEVVYHQMAVGSDTSGQPGGTHKPETGHRCWSRQQDLASNMVWQRFGGSNRVAFHREMGLRIKNMNLQHLTRTYTERCPITANIGGCSLTATTAAELKAEQAAVGAAVKPAR